VKRNDRVHLFLHLSWRSTRHACSLSIGGQMENVTSLRHSSSRAARACTCVSGSAMTLARYRASRCNDVNRRANRRAIELRPPVKVGLLDDSIELPRYDARRLRPWDRKGETQKARESARATAPRRVFHCAERETILRVRRARIIARRDKNQTVRLPIVK